MVVHVNYLHLQSPDDCSKTIAGSCYGVARYLILMYLKQPLCFTQVLLQAELKSIPNPSFSKEVKVSISRPTVPRALAKALQHF